MIEVVYRGKTVLANRDIIFADGCIKTDMDCLKISAKSKLRIEVHGNVAKVFSNNCCSIKGNVEQAEVGNVLTVDGFCKTAFRTYDTTQSVVNVDRRAYVFFGREADYWGAYSFGLGKAALAKSEIIRIKGDTRCIRNLISGQEVHLEIFGDVKSAEISNCLSVRGIVDVAVCGNTCNATMRRGGRPNPRKLYEEKKKAEEEALASIHDLFKGVHF